MPDPAAAARLAAELLTCSNSRSRSTWAWWPTLPPLPQPRRKHPVRRQKGFRSPIG